jgi:transposase
MRDAADRGPASSEGLAQLAALATENARLREEADVRQRENARLREETTRLQDALAQAQAVIAALRRQLFGAKADRLTPEQEAQVLALQRDVVDEAERPRPPSDDVLTEDRPVDRTRPPRRARQPLPDHLETETVVLEPDDTRCPGCGQPSRRIGEEVTEEIDLVPA